MHQIVIVAGSSRVDSQTAKVAGFIGNRLIRAHALEADAVSIIDLGRSPLPLWPADESGPWEEYEARLSRADAVIILAPEWHGMACPCESCLQVDNGSCSVRARYTLTCNVSVCA